MSTKTILDCERKSLDKLRKNQLPHRFKNWGIGIAILSFVLLFVNKFSLDSLTFREICKYGMLVGLLVVSISKDKIEDEWVTSLRGQSYAFAFVFGVVFSLIQPLVNFGVDSIIEGESAIFKDSGDFVVLWMLLTIQVFYFEYLKRISG